MCWVFFLLPFRSLFFIYLYVHVFLKYFFLKCLQFKIKIYSILSLVLYALQSLNVPVDLVFYFYFSVLTERDRETEKQTERKTDRKKENRQTERDRQKEKVHLRKQRNKQ